MKQKNKKGFIVLKLFPITWANADVFTPVYKGLDILWLYVKAIHHLDCLVQDFSISIALAMEILQFCTEPSICG